MRYLLFISLVVGVVQECCSQWQSVYPLSVYARDIAVAKPNYVYLLAQQSGISYVFKSSNGARTWKKFEIKIAEEELSSVFFTDSLRGYVGSYKGVYITTDGAKTWELNRLPSGFPDAHRILFTSQNTGYVSSQDSKIAKTTDGGKTWHTLSGAPSGFADYRNSISFSSDDHGYALSNSRLHKTSNGGETWTPVNLNYNIESVYAVNKDVAYISEGFSTHKTIDGGENWEFVHGWSAKLMHFKNVSEGLFFSNYSDILKTSNGGTDLAMAYHSDFTFSWFRVGFSGDFGCAIGGDNAIVTTTDGGSSWKLNQITPQHGAFRNVHFTSPQQGFIVGDDRGVIRTDDNASSWYYDENHFERDDIYQIAFSHPDTGIFVVTNNYAYTTYDGGESMFFNDWTTPIVGHLQSSDYEMINSKIIYTVGGKTKVAKSIDGGKSWTPFSFPFSNALTSIQCLDANTCHAAGMVGMVVSTWDGGEHWKVHNLAVNNDLGEVFLLNSTVGFIGGSNGTILRTSDEGHTWNILPTEAQWPVISFHFMTPEKAYAVTQGGEILRTDDSGQHWTLKQGTGIPGGSYYEFTKTFMRDTTAIYGFTGGSIHRWTPIEEVITAIERLASGKAFTIYPNPTSGSIYFHDPDRIKSIKITDMKGSVLRQYESNTSQIDISDLPPGIYMVRTTLVSEIQVNRIIKR